MEANERQEQLIADTLWVEHAIQFQIDRNDEMLRQIGSDIMSMGLKPTEVAERFDRLRNSNHEISSLAWFNHDNLLVTSSTEEGPSGKHVPDIPYQESGALEFDIRTRCFTPTLDDQLPKSEKIRMSLIARYH